MINSTASDHEATMIDKESASIIDKESEQDLLQALEMNLPIKEDELEHLIDQLKHDKGGDVIKTAKRLLFHDF